MANRLRRRSRRPSPHLPGNSRKVGNASGKFPRAFRPHHSALIDPRGNSPRVSRVRRLVGRFPTSQGRSALVSLALCQLSQPSHFWEGWDFSKSLILAHLGGFGRVGRVFPHSRVCVRVRVRARVRPNLKKPSQLSQTLPRALISFSFFEFFRFSELSQTLPNPPALLRKER